MSPQDLASLLGSRICHDLISPIGAISNGIELLQMADGSSGPEIDLISQSVANANARIRFFRVAFGAAAPEQMMAENEVRDILGDYSSGSRLRINWQAAGSQARCQIKLVFLMLQCLETAMPWGGQISAVTTQGAWTISATSDRMKINSALWDTLSNPAANAEIGAAEIQFILLAAELQSGDRNLALDISDTGIIARF